MFGLLAGTLNGAALGSRTVDFNNDDTSVTDTGHTIVAISLEAFGEITAIKRDVDRVVRELRGSRRLPGVDRVWLPGEQSQAKLAERNRDGVPVPAALLTALNKLASDLGIPALA